jgi:hypothetical protein
MDWVGIFFCFLLFSLVISKSLLQSAGDHAEAEVTSLKPSPSPWGQNLLINFFKKLTSYQEVPKGLQLKYTGCIQKKN